MPYKKKTAAPTPDFNASKLAQLEALQQDSESALATFNIAVAGLENANQKIDQAIADIKNYIASATDILNKLTAQRNNNARVIANITSIFGTGDTAKSEVA